MQDFISRFLGRKPGRPAQQSNRLRKRPLSHGAEPLEYREMMTVSVTPVYTVTNSWNSGFQADVR